MIFYGYFIFPEASAILTHYCFGNGSELILNSDYLKKSPVIVHHLREMKNLEKRKIGMHQQEDMRLSFALNPFSIEKINNKVIISQFIKFDHTGNTITWFGPIPVPDNIVHVYNCTPYNVKCEYYIDENFCKEIDSPNLFEKKFLRNHKTCKGCSKRNFRKI